MMRNLALCVGFSILFLSSSDIAYFSLSYTYARLWHHGIE